MSPEWTPSAHAPDADGVDPVAFLLTPSTTPESADGARILEVAQVLGDAVHDHRVFRPGATVRIADAPDRLLGGGPRGGPDFAAPRELLFEDAVELFTPVDGGWACTFHERWGGWLLRGEQKTSLRELCTSGDARRTTGGAWVTELRRGDRIVLDLGGVTFVARESARPRTLVSRVQDDVDPASLGILAFIGFTAVMVAVALGVVPPPPSATMLDTQDHVVDIDLLRQLLPPTPAVAAVKSLPKAESRAAGPPGRRGGGNPHGDATHAPGLLDALTNDAAFADLRRGTLDGGLQQGIRGLIGSRGASNGPGLGDRGDGFGDGGRVADANGLDFNGDRTGARDLAHGGVGGKREHALPQTDEVLTLGRYDKSLVDQVIKQHLNEIRYCYQRELPQTPGLSGKVTVKFTIAADGSVSTATTKASTLGSPRVEACINARFMRMSFPAPDSAGLVIVSYPFMFTTT